MAVADWKWQHIDWEATKTSYGYTEQSQLNAKSKVIVICSACKQPDLATSIVSMRNRSGHKAVGQAGYTPVCKSCQQARTWATVEGYRENQNLVQTEVGKKAWEDPSRHIRHSDTMKALVTERWQNENFRRAVSAGLKRKHGEDPEFRRKSIEALRTPEAVAARLANASGPIHAQRSRDILSLPDIKAKMSASSLKMWRNNEYRELVTRVTKESLSRPDVKRKMAQALANQPRISSLQHTLYRLLADLGLPFYPEGPNTVIGHYTFDCLIPGQDSRKHLLIECQGEYWHTLPGAPARDRSKFTYVDRYFPEYEILYLWEHEFYTDMRIINRLKARLGMKQEPVSFDFKNIDIHEISTEDAREFLDAYHYIGKNRGGMSYGAYIGNTLVAVAVYSPPLRQNTAAQFGLKDGQLRELSRLCIHPNYQKHNFGTWFISRTIKLSGPVAVVAYADTTAGHTGTVYKAANFTLHHTVPPDYWYVDADGFVMHKRTLYGRAVKMGIVEREYAELHGYQKRWGGEKLCFIRNINTNA